MSKYSKLSNLMRQEWDRRIKHDYRFWMSDGISDDQTMWESGSRDLELMCGDINDCADKVFLELGCGVGRILHAALAKFKRVIGVDVSIEAISKARQLLPSVDQLELLIGSGVDLQPVPDQSVDVVCSFAAITSIPTEVIANYLREIQRVLKPSGEARLQVYLGKEQPVHNEDTLHLRSYQEENFKAAIDLAGFGLVSTSELELPFKVSDQEIGFIAVKVCLKPKNVAPASAELISRALLPEGELDAGEAKQDDLEYWMSVNYAKELADQGDLEKAEETMEYALNFSKSTTIDVRDMLDRITNKLEKKAQGEQPETTSLTASEVGVASVLEKNLMVLRQRFPEVYQLISKETATAELEVKATEEGPTLFYRGQCLDHASKPRSAGAAWAKRTAKEVETKRCGNLIIFGFSLGYHLEDLLQDKNFSISVIEPVAVVFKKALEERDLTEILSSIKALSVGEQPNLDCLDENSELIVRPQAQIAAPDYLKKIKSDFYGARGIKSIHPRFAVLGPLQGGTLPIMGYTLRSLLMENQRVRDIDMSGFASGYHAISDVVKGDLPKVAAQGKYVSTLGQIVLDSLTEKPADVLICMALAPVTVEMLTEVRKRGTLTVLWFVEDYQRFLTWQGLAPHFDFIFTIQKGECIEAIKSAGCEEVHYLPTACDPLIHTPMELTAEDRRKWGSPISFMGAGYHNRQQTFASLGNMPFKIWGTEWPTCKPFDQLVQDDGRRLRPEEYIKVFNSSDININLHSSTERDGVDPQGDFLNPRTFELAGCGAFQLVDQRSLLGEVFTEGEEIITFSNTEDLK